VLYGAKFIQPGAADALAHEFGFSTPRTTASDLLADVWNGATSAARVFSVDLTGKFYSAAFAVGGIPYAVAGGVTGVKRLDPLAIGTAHQVLQVNAGATAPEWTSTPSLASLTLTAATGLTLPSAAGTFGGRLAWSTAGSDMWYMGGRADDSDNWELLSTNGGSNKRTYVSQSGNWNMPGGLTLAAGLAAVAGAFSGLLSANLGLTVAAGQTLTLTGATVTDLTAASVGAGTFPAGAFAFQGALSGITTLGASGVVTLTNATASSSPTTGALKVAGGLGVARGLSVEEGIAIFQDYGTFYLTGAHGFISVGGASGYIDVTSTNGYRVTGTKVLGAQGAPVANATDAPSTMARLNDLLARMRAHGAIAT
jgi:hypothetical protein